MLDISKDEFDIGVVQGSQCPEIFDGHIAKHPGLVRFKTCWKEHGCKCGEPDCFRHMLQYLIEDLDPAMAMQFADRCRGFEPMTKDEAAGMVDWVEKKSQPPLASFQSQPYVPFLEFGKLP